MYNVYTLYSIQYVYCVNQDSKNVRAKKERNEIYFPHFYSVKKTLSGTLIKKPNDFTKLADFPNKMK